MAQNLVAENEESEFPSKNKPAEVGDVVLFRCGENQIRPLIVTAIKNQGAVVSGRVVLGRSEEDRTLPAISATQFMVPHDTSMVYVEEVRRGTGEGCWDR